MRTMALWPTPPQVMSPTWRSHFWRFWGYCFVLPGLECRDSQRPWRQRCGVSRCWDWRRAHQKCACFATVYTGERSWSQSEANLSLQRRRFVSRCTVKFSKHEATRRLVDTKTQVLPRVSWRSDQDHCLDWQKRKNYTQEQHPKSWDMSAERILPKITLVYWIEKLSPKHWKLGRLSQDMNSPDENKNHFTKTGRWRTSTSWFWYQEFSWRFEESSWVTSRWIFGRTNWSKIKMISLDQGTGIAKWEQLYGRFKRI